MSFLTSFKRCLSGSGNANRLSALLVLSVGFAAQLPAQQLPMVEVVEVRTQGISNYYGDWCWGCNGLTWTFEINNESSLGSTPPPDELFCPELDEKWDELLCPIFTDGSLPLYNVNGAMVPEYLMDVAFGLNTSANFAGVISGMLNCFRDQDPNICALNVQSDAYDACRSNWQTWYGEGRDVFYYGPGLSHQYANQQEEICFSEDIDYLLIAVDTRLEDRAIWVSRQHRVVACEAIQRKKSDHGCS